MKKFKKVLTITSILLAIGTTSVTALAANAPRGNANAPKKNAICTNANCLVDGVCTNVDCPNLGVPLKDGTGKTTNPKGLGVGGMKLQDGSCYIK